MYRIGVLYFRSDGSTVAFWLSFRKISVVRATVGPFYFATHYSEGDMEPTNGVDFRPDGSIALSFLSEISSLRASVGPFC
jgi:hypothetical protein